MWLEVLRTVLYTLAALTVCALAFVVGIFAARQSARPPVPLELPGAPAAQAQHARQLVEDALAARFTGDNAKAVVLFAEAAAADGSLKGLDYQRGLCHLRATEFAQAEAAAKASLSKKEEIANAYALLVLCTAGRAASGEKTDADQVGEWARLSRAKDPLGSFVHYAMGEYNTAVGRPREAVENYRKARERVSAVDSFLVAEVKAGLSGLRVRQDSEQKGITPLITEENLPPERLFFAAGEAVLRSDKPTAQAFLGRARKVVRPEVFDALLQDSFFQDYLPEGIPNNPQLPGSP